MALPTRKLFWSDYIYTPPYNTLRKRRNRIYNYKKSKFKKIFGKLKK